MSEPYCKLWTLNNMMCQCSFILVGGVDNGGGYARVGATSVMGSLCSSFQFCCEPKMAL